MKYFSQTRIFILIMRNNYFVLFMSPVITSMNQTISTFSQIDFNISLKLITEYTRVENNIGQWNKVILSKIKGKEKTTIRKPWQKLLH